MDVDVFKQRFLLFHPKLYRIAYALLDNKADAEDILQDAYCKLWNKRDELGDIQNPEAFSITLVKNLCLDFLRSPKASRRDNEETLETADTFTDPEEAAVVAQNALAFMSRNLNKGLGQVNEASQEITKINKIVNKHLND